MDNNNINWSINIDFVLISTKSHKTVCPSSFPRLELYNLLAFSFDKPVMLSISGPVFCSLLVRVILTDGCCDCWGRSRDALLEDTHGRYTESKHGVCHMVLRCGLSIYYTISMLTVYWESYYNCCMPDKQLIMIFSGPYLRHASAWRMQGYTRAWQLLLWIR